MRKDMIQILAEKEQFIKSLEAALLGDSERSDLDSIVYEYDLSSMDEYITVIFTGGHTRKILATGNSNGANAKAILKAIY